MRNYWNILHGYSPKMTRYLLSYLLHLFGILENWVGLSLYCPLYCHIIWTYCICIVMLYCDIHVITCRPHIQMGDLLCVDMVEACISAWAATQIPVWNFTPTNVHTLEKYTLHNWRWPGLALNVGNDRNFNCEKNTCLHFSSSLLWGSLPNWVFISIVKKNTC